MLEAVTFSGMFIGVGRISARNWRDFGRRVMVWEQCFGALLNSNGNPRPLPPADIERRIGLSMNVVDISGAAFRAKLVERMNEEADRKIKIYESEKANG